MTPYLRLNAYTELETLPPTLKVSLPRLTILRPLSIVEIITIDICREEEPFLPFLTELPATIDLEHLLLGVGFGAPFRFAQLFTWSRVTVWHILLDFEFGIGFVDVGRVHKVRIDLEGHVMFSSTTL